MSESGTKKADVNGLLQEYMVLPLVDMFDKLWNEVRKGDDRIATFQRKLKDIPKWKLNIEVAHCIEQLDEQCSFINELITAMYLYHIKGIASLQNTSVSNVQFHLPSKAEFVHNILILMAKSYYEKPLIFRMDEKLQKLQIAHMAVEMYISKSLPVKAILDAYIASSVEPNEHKNVVILREENQPNAIVSELKSHMNALETNIVTNLQSNLGTNKKVIVSKPGSLSTTIDINDISEDLTRDSLFSRKKATLTLTPKKGMSSLTSPESTVESIAAVKTIVKSATPTPQEAALSLNILPEIHASAPKKDVLSRKQDAKDDVKDTKNAKDSTISSIQDTTVVSTRKVVPSKTPKTRAKKASPEKQSVSTSSLSRKQQKDLLDEILRYTRTKEMVTPSFFSDADSKEA